MPETPILEFERPLVEVQRQIAELKKAGGGGRALLKLEKKAQKLHQKIFSSLSRWEEVQLARHPARPLATDFIFTLFTDFMELCGDRGYGEDRSIIGGFARLDGRPVLVVGHNKGRSSRENAGKNYGMPRPEGLRKARRLFELAGRFARPIITFIDTPGAYPGIGAEERGQAQAIASCLETLATVPVPVVAVVTGEGGSGGALALGLANRLLMLEHAIYSVISPEGCASILYRTAAQAERAAESLKLTAKDMLALRVADELVPEAPGGAHRDPALTMANLGAALRWHLAEISKLGPEALVAERRERFRALGVFAEEKA